MCLCLCMLTQLPTCANKPCKTKNQAENLADQPKRKRKQLRTKRRKTKVAGGALRGWDWCPRPVKRKDRWRKYVKLKADDGLIVSANGQCSRGSVSKRMNRSPVTMATGAVTDWHFHIAFFIFFFEWVVYCWKFPPNCTWMNFTQFTHCMQISKQIKMKHKCRKAALLKMSNKVEDTGQRDLWTRSSLLICTFVLFNFHGSIIHDLAELACLSFSLHHFPKECADICNFSFSDLTLTAKACTLQWWAWRLWKGALDHEDCNENAQRLPCNEYCRLQM